MNQSPPLSAGEVLVMIDDAMSKRMEHEDPVSNVRRAWLVHLRELIATKGLTLTEDQKRDSCLMPVVFQELNYDGYSWAKRLTDLGHLEDIVEIDVAVWSGGFRRSALTDLQYEQYRRFCHQVLEYRRK